MELYVNNLLTEISEYSLCQIDGGTFWGIVSGVAEVVAGAAEVVGGVGLLLIPEPTTTTKIAGAASIVVGIATIGDGITTISSNI